MGKPTKFNALLYQLLDERLRTVENGGTSLIKHVAQVSKGWC